jgi:hypothetical protein
MLGNPLEKFGNAKPEWSDFVRWAAYAVVVSVVTFLSTALD